MDRLRVLIFILIFGGGTVNFLQLFNFAIMCYGYFPTRSGLKLSIFKADRKNYGKF